MDNDGDLDLVIVHQNEPVVLLRNESALSRKVLRLRLEGRDSNRSAIGAVVSVKAAGSTLTRSVIGGGSYLSQNDSRLLFGLDFHAVAEKVEVAWPSGATDRYEKLSTSNLWLIREGRPPMVDTRADIPRAPLIGRATDPDVVVGEGAVEPVVADLGHVAVQALRSG